MATPAKTPSRFGQQLRSELDRHPSIRSVRQLARAMNPDRPDVARRMLFKWIAGSRPTKTSRVLVAGALGIDASAFEDEDDEEGDSEMASFLYAALRAEIRRTVAAEIASLEELRLLPPPHRSSSSEPCRLSDGNQAGRGPLDLKGAV